MSSTFGEPHGARSRRTGIDPFALRSVAAALVAVAISTALAVGCSDGRSDDPSSIPSTSRSAGQDRASDAASSSSPSTSVLPGIEVVGIVSAIEAGPPPTLDCFPTDAPDPTALCPPAGDDVLGSVTIDGAVVLVTEATVVETCGPDDGGVTIAFEETEELLDVVTALDARAAVVAPPSGGPPGWARATKVFLGSCG